MIIGSLASGFLEQPEERIVNLEKLVKLVDAEQQTAIEFRYIEILLVLLYAVASLQWPLLLCPLIILTAPGLGICKRKKENKKTRTCPRKHACVHEKKNSLKKTGTRPRKRPRKKDSFKKTRTRTRKKRIFLTRRNINEFYLYDFSSD